MSRSVPDEACRIRHWRLAGPSVLLDRRVHAIRADLADVALAEVVAAPRYAEAVAEQCGVAVAMLRAGPGDEHAAVSALLYGETFDVFDVAGDWAWGQCSHDSYIGWIERTCLAPAATVPSHVVSSPTAAAFAEPDIKSAVVATLPLNARVEATRASGSFHHVAAAGGYLHDRHIAPLGAAGADPVALALAFVGSPYVWGGRTRDGIDCSGLTQAVLAAAGIACPRDSDQQRDQVGEAVGFADRARGDLVCFPGHVGILLDADTLIHANAFWMTTLAEPLAAVVERLAMVTATPISAIRRPHAKS
ncbi:MAG: NlpC/P60 family protein [Janthinobacterium lividum]